MSKGANTAVELTSSSGENVQRMERRAEIVEEVIISLRFVCNVEKGKNLR